MTIGTTQSERTTIHRPAAPHPASHSKRLSSNFLIANPRLEFRLTHRKESLLKISNREEIAFFHIVLKASDDSAPSADPGRRSPTSSSHDFPTYLLALAHTHPRKPSHSRPSAPLATSHSQPDTAFLVCRNRGSRISSPAPIASRRPSVYRVEIAERTA